jgi:hypothetical protein
VLRSFVNTCSHRGAIVVEEGTGVTRRFSCPFHAWTYDTRGSLVGILDRAAFGDVDMSCLGLTALPVAERAGLVFGGITPGMPFDIDAYLGIYGDLLEHLGLASCQLVGRQTVAGPNWKIAYDGYLTSTTYQSCIGTRSAPTSTTRRSVMPTALTNAGSADKRMLELDGSPRTSGLMSVSLVVSGRSFRTFRSPVSRLVDA